MSTDTRTEQKPEKFLDPKANLKALARLVVIVVVLLGGVWLFIRYTAGEKAANRATATVLRQPVNLADTTEDLPASSFKALPLSLPYTGTLSIEVAVRRGNDISIYVVRPDQIEKIKAKQEFSHFPDFQADKTKSYRRSARFSSGTYYLVLLDKTLGVLSRPTSDVQVRARLQP